MLTGQSSTLIQGRRARVAATSTVNGQLNAIDDSLSAINCTFIALIPKVLNPSSMNQFRPISLCNFIYKIFAKVIATRLKPMMDSLISHNQSAFVANRSIQDSILVAHEAFHYLKHRKKGKRVDMAIKLDLNKAYDRVEWDFLLAVLIKMGFDRKWVNIISQCISTVSFRVLFNGEPGKKFFPQRGLRQGDPLSPFLFLFVQDALSLLVKEAIFKREFSGIRLKTGCPWLSHMFFADDSLIFTRLEGDNLLNFLQVLQIFGKASGQNINFDKSGFFLSANATHEDNLRVESLLKMKKLELGSNYLGLPSATGSSKIATLEFIIDRIRNKLKGWKIQFLSQAGREILIKAVIQAIPAYAMTCFLFPKALCNKINALIRFFWWGGDEKSKKIAWKNWRVCTKSKDQGGLGFKDLNLFNKALLAKQCWRMLIQPDAFWARFFKSLYFPNSSLMEAKKGGSASWAWISLLEGRNILASGLLKSIGSGNDTRVGVDPWIPDLKGHTLGSCLATNLGFVTVNTLISTSSRVWQEPLIRALFSKEIADSIVSIPLSRESHIDKWVWAKNSSGILSVKSAYREAKDQADKVFEISSNASSSSLSLSPRIWRLFWSSKAQPKMKLFWWKAVSNAAPTAESLRSRAVPVSPWCPSCGLEVETIEHILFRCREAKSIWKHFEPIVRFKAANVVSIARWMEAICGAFQSSKAASDFLGKIITIAWGIWLRRNETIFKAEFSSLGKTFLQIKRNLESLSSGNSGISTFKPRVSSISASVAPSPGSCLKFYCDGAFLPGTIDGVCGGALIRDNVFVDGFGSTFCAKSTLISEAYAIREATYKAANANLSGITILSDSKTCIDALSGNIKDPWVIATILNDIRIQACNVNVKWQFISRSRNFIAHWIAASSLHGLLPCNWISSPPVELEILLSK
jgi:ribonuclease HI